MDNNKNFLLFVVLSIGIVFGFNYLRGTVPPPVVVEATAVPPSPVAVPAALTLQPRAEVIKNNPRVAIQTPELTGSINLKGVRIDDLVLPRYRETADPQSPPVTLLSPAGSAPPANAFYTEFSWLAADKDVAMPTADSLWQADGKILTPEHPLKLTWKNAGGLQFERTIAVDEHYMFTLTDHVVNNGAAAVTLYPFGLVAQQGNPTAKTSSLLHEGMLGVFDGTLDDVKYAKLISLGKKARESEGGWLGITSKYWLVAVLPPAHEKIAANFVYDGSGVSDADQGHFQADYRGAPIVLAAGASAEHVTRLFAGAKRLSLLDGYADKFDVPHLDRAIDFGWRYFLAEPFLYMLNFLSSLFGDLGIAILVFTVLLKLVTLPLSLKANHSAARMKLVQPELKKLQERFADDKLRLNQEMMALFKREKVSPMSGCVPMLIQIPIFLALYSVLSANIEMRHTPFFGWIHDMSEPDPTSWFNLFGLAPWALPTPFTLNLGLVTLYVPPALHIGLWPLIMGVTMFLQQKMTPQPMDKSQARMFMFLPLIFTYTLSSMPAGLVIYWTWSNFLSIVQQWVIMRRDAKGAV